jgi:hypothetical protein
VATLKTLYASSASITITLNSLGSGAARESTVIDNGTNKYLDAHVRVTVNVGSVSGSPLVHIYAYGSEDGSLYPDPLTGADAAVTLEDPTVLRHAIAIPTPTSSKAYESDVISIARLYGGVLPRKWGIVVVNTTGAALAGSGNSASFTGINLESV